MNSNSIFVRSDYKEYNPCGLSVFEYLKRNAEKYSDLCALRFFGIEFSFEELFENIDITERALLAAGVSKNDIVALSLPSIPEGVFLLYAINKVGARYCAFDCRSQEKEILEMVEKFDPKLCIVPDFQLKTFKNVKDREIVVVNPTHSIGGVTKVTSAFADFFTGRTVIYARQKNTITYERFLKRGSCVESGEPQRAEDNIFGYFYTSGTTYGRKSIVLTNENINASVYQSGNNEKEVAVGDVMLNIMPMFTCYGVTNATHLPLSLGVQVDLIPLVNPKRFKKLVLKEKPNYIMTVPAHWEYFANGKFKNCDLSFLKAVVVGGDKLDPTYESNINRIFSECGSKAYLRAGYGLSETTSIGVTASSTTPKGSVGKAMISTLVGVFDPETMDECEAYKKGEICFFGPSICQGYYEEEEMTARLLRLHDDGRVWLHTGDAGYMDEDGNLFFCERIKRMYVRYDGTKISPYSIEQILQNCDAILRCMVVPVRDKDHSHGMCAKAIVVKKGERSEREARRIIDKYIRENMGEHMIPKEIVFVERLPYTKNGKLDYFAAQK